MYKPVPTSKETIRPPGVNACSPIGQTHWRIVAENAWPLNTAKSTPPIWLSRNQARQLFAPRFMSLYGTDSFSSLLFSSSSSPSFSPSFVNRLSILSILRIYVYTHLSPSLHLSRTHLFTQARNHFSHRNYTWPANLSIIQSREDDCARAKVRELELHFSTRHFSLLLFPAQLSWPDRVDNWRTWISAKRDSLMNALSFDRG